MMPFAVLLVLSFLGSIIPAVVLNLDRKQLLWTGIGGMLGYGLAVLLSGSTSPGLMPVFAGAVLVGLYSEGMARIRKTPAISFCIPGIFPLVPGIDAYKTMQFLVNGDLGNAATTGIRTVAIAFAIAFGIMLVTSFYRIGKDKVGS